MRAAGWVKQIGARTVGSQTRSRNCAGVYVGAEKPRMTIQTEPLSPCVATVNPDAVSILTVARADTLSGAALLAKAISASGAIKYSVSGGYLEFWAQTIVVLILVSKITNARTSFFIFIFPFLRLCLHHVLRAAATRGYVPFQIS